MKNNKKCSTRFLICFLKIQKKYLKTITINKKKKSSTSWFDHVIIVWQAEAHRSTAPYNVIAALAAVWNVFIFVFLSFSLYFFDHAASRHQDLDCSTTPTSLQRLLCREFRARRDYANRKWKVKFWLVVSIRSRDDEDDDDACVRFEPEIIERARPGTIGILTATGNERVRTERWITLIVTQLVRKLSSQCE